MDGDKNMHQTATWWAKISQAALMPIDKFVDWLEGAYAD